MQSRPSRKSPPATWHTISWGGRPRPAALALVRNVCQVSAEATEQGCRFRQCEQADNLGQLKQLCLFMHTVECSARRLTDSSFCPNSDDDGCLPLRPRVLAK